LSKTRIKNRENFNTLVKRYAGSYQEPSPLNSELLQAYRQLVKSKKIKPSKGLEKHLQKRSVRSMSGVAVITCLTKPMGCPHTCVFCPTEDRMPKSYLSNEPAVMRALMNQWDPYRQVKTRLKALSRHGHATDKIELIVIGGTWSAHPKRYQAWYVKRLLDALNGKTSTTLLQAQKLNEKASHRCVGLTLETRPDWIDEAEIKQLRKLGCTRVEIGIQNPRDDILKLSRRGHGVKEIVQATKLLKEAGFKICYHTMPQLPGSTPAIDLQMYKDLYGKEKFQPDLVKIYPTAVVKTAELYDWMKRGDYTPYSDAKLKTVLKKAKLLTPEYVRIVRLIRDIPAESIEGGNKITNLRQLISYELKKESKACQCIRCREVGHQSENKKSLGQPIKLRVKKYRASGGTEYFISFASQDNAILYAYVRLRINDESKDHHLQELRNAALIREIHTYGPHVKLGESGMIQHTGLGKKLMAEAEYIAGQENRKRIKAKKSSIAKVAVIAAAGVREYYRKLGYRLDGTYMSKRLLATGK